MKRNSFNALKKQCANNNLVLRFDSEKNVYSINLLGRSGFLFTSLTLSPVENFLSRYCAKKRAEVLDAEELFQSYVDSFYEDAYNGDNYE